MNLLPLILMLILPPPQEAPAPPPALAHFHHLHLNSTDPAAAIQFYTSRLESEERKFADGQPSVFAHNAWLLFNKVAAPPKREVTSAIWHMGWGGGPDMQTTYKKQLELGTKFFVPITDISDQCDGKGGNGRFWFAYIDAPDHALIELNTTAAGQNYFGHVHLLSNDALAAADWYVKEFDLTRRGSATPSREVRYRCGRQTTPAASLMMDDVNVIIYPVGNAKAAFPDWWKDRADLESPAGHSIDHLGFRVADLDATLTRLKADNVTVLAPAAWLVKNQVRAAMIEGPDHVRIELIEEKP
jgi:catechol 2,3-dioxygenase-like lactoylglutathione lyase family enzyme